MKILDAGHHYHVIGYDGGEEQSILFMKRQGENFPFNAHSNGGTNCQEVLRVLIDRTLYLQRQQPCAETESIIGCLQTALLLFETRAARKRDKVLELHDLSLLSSLFPCETCGHLYCTEDHPARTR